MDHDAHVGTYGRPKNVGAGHAVPQTLSFPRGAKGDHSPTVRTESVGAGHALPQTLLSLMDYDAHVGTHEHPKNVGAGHALLVQGNLPI